MEDCRAETGAVSEIGWEAGENDQQIQDGNVGYRSKRADEGELDEPFRLFASSASRRQKFGTAQLVIHSTVVSAQLF